MISLKGQGSEFFLEEEGRVCKKLMFKTKHFPACFPKTGRKTIVSTVQESCPTLYNVQKRLEKMTKVAQI